MGGQRVTSLAKAAKSLHEIRSEACNAILITLTSLAIPAVLFSLLRGIEQGFRPVMGLHVALLLMIAVTTLGRKHLSLTLRAGVATFFPYVIGTAGIILGGRGNGMIMFYISAIVVAGCFFERRIALAVVGLCVVSVGALYLGHITEILPIPLAAAQYDMTPLSWLAFAGAFVAAGISPFIGLSAVLRSLDAERERADLAAKVRSDFLSNMSHELRTPMAGILGMADVLKTTPLSMQQQNLIANLTVSARTLLTVLNDVLDLAKFESGQVPIEKEPFKISNVIQNVSAILETRALQKGISLRTELPSRLSDQVTGDAMRIGQVLTNLIDNAIKFTARGTVLVRVEQVLRDEDGIDLVFRIADTGVGIAPEDMELIFQPFMQADMSTARMQGGTGLGLSICRHLASAMGGQISVSSQPGVGSTFTFTVPVERAVAPPVTLVRSLERSSPILRAAKAPIRLLIADDDKNMRTLAEIMLSRRGYEMTLVEDGAAAVESALAATYDCIIVDMHMPVMHGPDVMRAIQKAEMENSRRRTPMIALTADVIPDHIRKFVNAGADAVVAKPVDWNQLDAKIQELTAIRLAARAS